MTDRIGIQADEIFAAIEAAPPLMRDNAAQHFIGTVVDWVVTLASGSTNAHGEASLVFRFVPRLLRIAAARVPLAAHPFLATLRAEEPLRIRGRIQSISPTCIELQLEDLSAEPAYAAHQS